jgi:hypothetical protein
MLGHLQQSQVIFVSIIKSSKLLPELEKRLKATILVAAKRTIESKWVKQHRS